ncbi:uncharacterized protein BDZ99DRAFT_265954 [Mytilinidion resinicola]|uniref:Uncharacterized protein n=1 Tax=Mytilinidion resinicola TaxID=574789 RepID=A0A6A6YWN4_9PEZI|nr:uncharacterized protein BDZ99DRAFT_265954 [Mytilinidion resinicola]KAF2812395.1 hypothetical protein BDZ99DRAFT_265954 [Mytilinidion resinicola]
MMLGWPNEPFWAGFHFELLNDVGLAICRSIKNTATSDATEAATPLSKKRSWGFFGTKNRYLGIGPQLTRRDDRVRILFGSEIPAILHKTCPSSLNSRWTLFYTGLYRGRIS